LSLSSSARKYIGIGSGTIYLYSAYAPQLAAQLKFSVTEASAIGLIASTGAALTGPFSGSLVDSRGPSLALFIGAALIFGGYSVVRAAYSHALVSSFPLISAALLCVGGGSTFVLSAVVKCAAVNFPEVRGFATSVPMAAFGLSAFVVSRIGSTFYPGDTYGLLSILVYLPAAIFLFAYFYARFVPTKGPNIQDQISEAAGVRSPGRGDAIQMVHMRQPSVDAVLYNSSATKSNAIDIYGTKLLKSSLFWTHFFVMGILAGIGQMYIYSCGYIVNALVLAERGSLATTVAAAASSDASAQDAVQEAQRFLMLVQETQSFHVGIISLSNFAGRLCSGTFSDYLVNRLQLQRDWLLLGAAVLAGGSQMLGIYVEAPAHLWAISMGSGLMYGVCFGSYPMIVGDAFGMAHFSQNWGILALSPIPTAYFFNMLFGMFYDHNSAVDAHGHRECSLGKFCYNEAFRYTTVFSLVALVLALTIILKHRKGRLF
jgi:MFS family permease